MRRDVFRERGFFLRLGILLLLTLLLLPMVCCPVYAEDTSQLVEESLQQSGLQEL